MCICGFVEPFSAYRCEVTVLGEGSLKLVQEERQLVVGELSEVGVAGTLDHDVCCDWHSTAWRGHRQHNRNRDSQHCHVC